MKGFNDPWGEGVALDVPKQPSITASLRLLPDATNLRKTTEKVE